MHSEPCAMKKVLSPQSTRATSAIASPNAVGDRPAVQGVRVRGRPVGKGPASLAAQVIVT